MGQIFVNGVQYSGELTDASNIKYAGAASGLSAATVQGAIDELATAAIQSDWNETDTTQKDFIKNKPAVTSGARTGSIMVGSNYVDNGTYLMAVGTGAMTAANAHTLDQNGNAWFKGNAYVGGTNQSNAQALATVNYVSNQVLTRAPIQHTHSASDLTGGYMEKPGYLSLHPENADAGIIPFINNDLAFLLKKGGSCEYYYTTDTDYTVLELTKDNSLSINVVDNMFDGSPSYAGVQNANRLTETVIIDLTLPRNFNYTNKFYIDFGSPYWRAKNIKLLIMNGDTETTYTQKGAGIENSERGHWTYTISHTSTNSSGATVQGFNKIRIVLSNWNQQGRIAQIGLIEYASQGLKETFISRGGCNGIYGSLTPHTSGLYSLGTNSKKWGNIYSNYLNSDQIVVNGTLTSGGSISTAGVISANTVAGNTAKFDTFCKIGNTKFTYDAANERVVISFE